MFSVSALSTHFQLSTHLPVTQSNIGVVSRFSGSLKISPCEERILNIKCEDRRLEKFAIFEARRLKIGSLNSEDRSLKCGKLGRPLPVILPPHNVFVKKWFDFQLLSIPIIDLNSVESIIQIYTVCISHLKI